MKKLLSFILLIPSLSFAANDVFNTKTENTIVQNTITNSPGQSAKEWSLTETEWKKYLTLMQGFSGHYYKQLSPPEVLGIKAETPEEMQHYAEISAKLEHDKLERELRFNTAFHDAAARLYAVEPLIKPFDYSPFVFPKDSH